MMRPAPIAAALRAANSASRGFTAIAVVLSLQGALLLCASASAQLRITGKLSTKDQIHGSYLEQNLGAQLPNSAEFKNASGHSVRLGDYFGTKPTLLIIGYFTCPDLCPMAFRHLTEELNGIGPLVGRDFQVLIVSFDPRDTPKRAMIQKINCIRAYKSPRNGIGWHFLTGQPKAIDALTTVVGFHYSFDSRTQRYIHPTGVIVLSPSGKITHVFGGIDASPADVEAALHDAVVGRASRVDEPLQQYCVDYDPTLTPRGRKITRILQAGCITWVIILFGYIGYKITGDIRRRNQQSEFQEANP